MQIGYAIGATAAIDADSGDTISAGATRGGTGIKTTRKSGLAAAAAIVAKYKQSATGTTVSKRVLQVRPIAVGG
jgi:hypothetical protein